jgi:hypothetical protein
VDGSQEYVFFNFVLLTCRAHLVRRMGIPLGKGIGITRNRERRNVIVIPIP